MLAAIVLAATAQDAAAQKWLKKLGQALETVNEVATAVTGTPLVDTDGAIAVDIPNVDFTITGCESWGNDAIISVVATNKTTKDLKLSISSVGNAYFMDENSTKYDYEFFIGGEAVMTTLPANIPVKGYFRVKNVPRTTTAFKQMALVGTYTPSGEGGKSFTASRALNLPITYAENTNAANVVCTLPIVNFKLNSITRVGNDAVVDATITNTSAADIKLYAPNYTVYDTEGNRYTTIESTAGTTKWDYDLIFVQNVPTRATFTIKNVPAGLAGFSLVKIGYKYDNHDFCFEIRNQALTK